MFVFLHVLVLYVERSCEVWPRRNQLVTGAQCPIVVWFLQLHVIPTNLITKCHSIGHFNSQLRWTWEINFAVFVVIKI